MTLLFCFSVSYLATAQFENLPAGQIIDSIRCNDSSNQTYALYLPKNYSDQVSWPIIYFFEPMARGTLPLERYSQIAEKHGFILVCSNNSRNGPLENNLPFYKTIKNETEKKLNIDKNHIYTSGFSGGARLAQYIAQNDETITGTITVAGPKFGEESHLKNVKNYLYFGIVGNCDMNYIEHKEFQSKLNLSGIKNTLLTYSGGHQWAPAKYFDHALAWMNIQILISTKSDRHQSAVESFVKARIAELDTSNDMPSSNLYNYFLSLKQSFNPIKCEQLNAKIKTLQGDKSLMKSISKEEKILDREKKYYETIYDALYQLKLSAFNPNHQLDSSQYSMDWWQQQINMLQVKAGKADIKGNSASRTLDVIRGQVFGLNLQENAKYNLTFKLYLNQIQSMLYPESVWIWWNQALIYAELREKDTAVACLKKANQIDNERLQKFQQGQRELSSLYPYLF